MTNMEQPKATRVSRSQRGKGARVHRDGTQSRNGGGFWQKLKKSREPYTGEMSLVEHIQELRRRVIISIIAICIGAIFGFIWYQHALGPIPSLGEILRGPYCNLPADKRAMLTSDGECRLIATTPFDMLILRLKVAGLAGLVVSSPVWLLQIWGFITPGLMKNERRWTFAFVTTAVTLFVLGAVLAYVVITYGLEFLMTIGGEYQVATLSGHAYFEFILQLLMIFGVSFEVPLILIMLNLMGLLTYEALKDKRRIVVVVMFVFAAAMTPGQDPYSMVCLALALTLLVEFAIQFCRINDKRRAKQTAEWAEGLDDDTASPTPAAPTSIAPSAPIDGHPGGTVAASPRPTASPTPQASRGGYGQAGSVAQPAPVERPQPLNQQSSFDDVI